MKTKILYLIFGIMLLIFSCKNPCKNVDCGNGLCNKDDGNCYCADGWLKDANGKCNKQDFCYQKDCGHGACNDTDGGCNCEPGWSKDAEGKCTIFNPCYGVDCGTYGTCNASTGSCDCLPGYEVGTNGKCEVEMRAKFLNPAGWFVTDICPSGTYNYDVFIVSSSLGVDKVIMRPYGGYSAGSTILEATATISGNTITIPAQTSYINGQTFEIQNASANLVGGNTFNLVHTVTIDGSFTETCNATFTKK